jgi:hypothetical protein
MALFYSSGKYMGNKLIFSNFEIFSEVLSIELETNPNNYYVYINLNLNLIIPDSNLPLNQQNYLANIIDEKC